MAAPDFLQIGRVLGSVGVHGEIKVEPTTDNPSRFRTLDRVLVGAARIPVRVQRARLQGGLVTLKLEGVDDPESARQLRNAPLFVSIDERLPLPVGDYYLYELVGLTVYTPAGEELGQVGDIITTAANDVYVVHGPRGEILIPALHTVVTSIDVSAGRMVVELPEGLVE